MLVIYNGQLLSESEKIFSSLSRSYRYGDGFFESIKVVNRTPLWIQRHTDRMRRTANVLKFHWPEKLNADYLQEVITNLCWKSGHINARCRITLFREGQGYYMPENARTHFLIELEAHPDTRYKLNEQGLKLGDYQLIPKPSNILSLLKTTSALSYVLSGISARENGYDTCLLYNEQGRVSEVTNANIFIVQEQDILTPALSEYCLDGIMRKLLIELGRSEGLNIIETAINEDELAFADEVFVTNATTGIRWVESYRDKYYGYEMAFKLTEMLNNAAGLI